MLEHFLVNLKNLDDTEKLGNVIGRATEPGDIICLNGDLGAGKTTLTQAIARGLNVPSRSYVTSPSFAIMHEYTGIIPLYHMDFYRLSDSSDVIDLGFEEYFYLDGLTVIEWAERAADILPEERVSIDIKLNNDEIRTVSFSTANEALANRFEIIISGFKIQQYSARK